MSLVCGSGIVIEVRKYRWRIEYLIPTSNSIVVDSYFNLMNKSNLFGRLLCDLIRFFDHLVVATFWGHPVFIVSFPVAFHHHCSMFDLRLMTAYGLISRPRPWPSASIVLVNIPVLFCSSATKV